MRIQGDKSRQPSRKQGHDLHYQQQSADGQQSIGGRKIDKNNLTSQNVHEVMS